MKRKLVLSSALVLLVALMAWSTWAYFTTSARTTNVITTGTINITLNEMTIDAVTGETVPYPSEPITGIMPGVPVSKIVSVTNDNAASAGEAWVRVRVDTTIISGEDLDGNGEKDDPLPTTFTHGQDTLDAVVIEYNTTAADAKWIPYTVTEKDADGRDQEITYYYYKTPLAKGEATSALFSTVKLNEFLTNDYQGCTVNIVVSAQAVQVKNNNTYTGEDGQPVLITELTIETETTKDTISKIEDSWPKAQQASGGGSTEIPDPVEPDEGEGGSTDPDPGEVEETPDPEAPETPAD